MGERVVSPGEIIHGVTQLPGAWSSFSHNYPGVGQWFLSLEFVNGSPKIYRLYPIERSLRNSQHDDWPYSKPNVSPTLFNEFLKLGTTIFTPVGQSLNMENGANRIAQGLEKRPLNVPGRITRLPPKIWLQALKAMPPETASAFASTCRYTYLRYAKPCRARLMRRENHRARAEFLNYWDHLLPDRRFCHFCLTWHWRSKSEEWDFTWQSLKWFLACPLGQPSFIELPQSVRLDWAKVQLVMRRVRLSPSHGISFKRLSNSYSVRQWRQNHWCYQVRATVVRGRLLLRVKGTLQTTNKNLAWLQELRESRRRPVECIHGLFNDTLEICACAIRHLFQNRGEAASSSSSGTRNGRQCDLCGHVRRCHECPTEYFVQARLRRDIESGKGTNGFTNFNDPEALFLTITLWKDLGKGISPFSPEWTALTTCSKGYHEYHASGPYNVGNRGSIYERFETSVGNRLIIPTEVKPSIPRP